MRNNKLLFFANAAFVVCVSVILFYALGGPTTSANRLITDWKARTLVALLFCFAGMVHLHHLFVVPRPRQADMSAHPDRAREWFRAEAEHLIKEHLGKRWAVVVGGASLFTSFGLFFLGFDAFELTKKLREMETEAGQFNEKVKTAAAHATEQLTGSIGQVTSVDQQLRLAMHDPLSRKALGRSWLWLSERRSKLAFLQIGLRARANREVDMYLSGALSKEQLRNEQLLERALAQRIASVNESAAICVRPEPASLGRSVPFPEAPLMIAEDSINEIFADGPLDNSTKNALNCILQQLLAAQDEFEAERALKAEEADEHTKGETPWRYFDSAEQARDYENVREAFFLLTTAYYLHIVEPRCKERDFDCSGIERLVGALSNGATASDRAGTVDQFFARSEEKYRQVKGTEPFLAHLTWRRGFVAFQRAGRKENHAEAQQFRADARKYWLSSLEQTARIREDEGPPDDGALIRDPVSLNSLAWQYVTTPTDELPQSRLISAVRYAKLAEGELSHSTGLWADVADTYAQALWKAGFSYGSVRTLFLTVGEIRQRPSQAPFLKASCQTFQKHLDEAIAEYDKANQVTARRDPLIAYRAAQLHRMRAEEMSQCAAPNDKEQFCAARRELGFWAAPSSGIPDMDRLSEYLKVSILDEKASCAKDLASAPPAAGACLGAFCPGSAGTSYSLNDWSSGSERATALNNFVWEKYIRSQNKLAPTDCNTIDRALFTSLMEHAREATFAHGFTSAAAMDTFARVAYCSGNEPEQRAGWAVAELLRCRGDLGSAQQEVETLVDAFRKKLGGADVAAWDAATCDRDLVEL